MSSPSGEPIPDISSRLMNPSIVFCFVTPLFVGLRVASRLHFTKRLGRDDWTILISCLFSVILSITMIIVCKWAFGKHMKQQDLLLVQKSLKLYVGAQVVYKVTIALSKISIIFLYLRIFVGKIFRRTCWSLIWIVICYTIGSSTATVFQCTPIHRAWQRQVPGTCINLTISWYSNAAFSILSDLAILILPMPVIKSLLLPKKEKIGLMSIFAVGIFVCITSVLRSMKLDVATKNFDVTWSSIDSSMWTIFETNIAIICACMPTFKAPISKIFPRAFDSFYSARGGQESKDDSYLGAFVHRGQAPVVKVPFYSLTMPRFIGWELVVEKLELWAKRMGNGSSSSFEAGKGGDTFTISNGSTVAGENCQGKSECSEVETPGDLEYGKRSTVTLQESTKQTAL
ncbi:uncharacterized protein BDCG_01156 [Blastomyces dermatitidis ER-3]|uniref:Integral membrane protein n=2 Tax=Ajellomyces dermatitidis TaxID=5039 RepID=F2TMX1_AJEDA|nr:uncharacterized protein BDCG_01156 [Blastomyces dermatitidis ER-3]EEQ84351.2 integral membrane protein [Blastomyces dermatitidis ER-3]EGE84584.1 integral membrane protein [Blastomyces dermatitidis ATCC 18188]EQL28647.1 hypothetical protein BDFG_08646 [Blastomyces dermatitidis ATCC 26199]